MTLHEPDLEPHLSDIAALWRQVGRRGGKVALPSRVFFQSLLAPTLCTLLVLVSVLSSICSPFFITHDFWIFPLGIALFSIALARGYKACWQMLRGYSFRVLGENLSRAVTLTSWQVVKITDLHGLEGKALIIHLQGKTLFPHVKLPRSLVLKPYRPEREVRYRIRVCGFDEAGEHELTTHLALHSDGLVPMNESKTSRDNCTVLLPIYQNFARYSLEIKVEDADGFAPREETCIKQLFFKVHVAVPTREIGRSHEVSIGHADVAIVDED